MTTNVKTPKYVFHEDFISTQDDSEDSRSLGTISSTQKFSTPLNMQKAALEPLSLISSIRSNNDLNDYLNTDNTKTNSASEITSSFKTPISASSTKKTPVSASSTKKTPVSASSTKKTPISASSTKKTPISASSTKKINALIKQSSGSSSSLLNTINNNNNSGCDVFKTPLPKIKVPSGQNKPTRSVTPRTRSGPSPYLPTPSSVQSCDETLASTIIAVVKGRGHAEREVGIAALDLTRPVLTLSQYSDTHTYTKTFNKLFIVNPIEILVADTIGSCDLIRLIKESNVGANVTTLQRKYFNESKGLNIIKSLRMHSSDHLDRQLNSQYYSLSAAAALMKYVEHIQHVFYAPNSLYIKLVSADNNFTIDHVTCRQLEIVTSLDGGWESSLFGILRHTSTPSGTKLLRSSLLQPLSDKNATIDRLEALQYIVEHPELFYTIQSILKRFPDLDWLLSMCVLIHKQDDEQKCAQRLNYVIGLKNTLELLQPLVLALQNVDDKVLTPIRKTFDNEELVHLQDLLREVIHEDARLVKGAAGMRTQRCFAIKSSVNGMLDVARKVYSEIIDQITKEVEELAKAHKLQLRVGQNVSNGFHIFLMLTKNQKPPKLSSIFIQVKEMKRCITCTTEKLYQLNQRSRDILREILIMSNVIVLELINEVRSRVGVLYNIAEAIANLDLLTSLAHTASIGGWVKPNFDNFVHIKEGRHPILDIIKTNHLEANDTDLGAEARLMVITGPNMSGKTTYIKQVALIQILSQIGSFVPAKSATLMFRDQIFTLLTHEEGPENNASLFQVQMNEVAMILKNATPRSLVLLDELGSGTNQQEGTSISWAIMEMLVKIKCFVLLASHVVYLTHMADIYPQISNYHMECDDSNSGRLIMRHQLIPGVCKISNYGLSLAEITTMPESLIYRAKQISTSILQDPYIDNEDEAVDRVVYFVAHEIITLAASIFPCKRNLVNDNCGPQDNQSIQQLKNLMENIVKHV